MKDLERYIVIPTKYLKELSEASQFELSKIISTINNIRKTNGETENPSYIVCKDNEPYAELVWELILRNTIDDQMVEAHDILDAINVYTDIDEMMCRANDEIDLVMIKPESKILNINYATL